MMGTYSGAPCIHHPDNTIRFQSNYRCIVCAKLKQQSAIGRQIAIKATQAYHARNPEYRKAYQQSESGKVANRKAVAKWNKAHPETAAANSMLRHASKLLRTPTWANLDAISIWYVVANEFGFEVDHVIPLRGELMSGLHVHTNLQLLTKHENMAKGNSFTVE